MSEKNSGNSLKDKPSKQTLNTAAANVNVDKHSSICDSSTPSADETKQAAPTGLKRKVKKEATTSETNGMAVKFRTVKKGAPVCGEHDVRDRSLFIGITGSGKI